MFLCFLCFPLNKCHQLFKLQQTPAEDGERREGQVLRSLSCQEEVLLGARVKGQGSDCLRRFSESRATPRGKG